MAAAPKASRAEDGEALPLQLVAVVDAEIRHAVASRRSVDPNPDDAFRGLYLSEEDADRLVDGGWPALLEMPPEVQAAREAFRAALASAPGSRLGRFVERFGLGPIDLDLLAITLAPDLDARFERLYGYLNDDVTRRRATIALAFELAGVPSTLAAARGRLAPASPLVRGGLVLVEETDRPFLTRSLRVPDRVIAHLLGDDAPEQSLVPYLADPTPSVAVDAGPLVRALEAGADLVYLREQSGSVARPLAAEALAGIGLGTVALDLNRLDPDTDLSVIARVAEREARLVGAGLVVGPVDALGDQNRAKERAAVRAFGDLAATVVLIGRSPFDPLWSRRVPVVLDAPTPEGGARLAAWTDELGATSIAEEMSTALAAFQLSPEQVARTAEAARLVAAVRGTEIGVSEIRAGALGQNAAGLERLARRIEPDVGFDDLVLPPMPVRMLRELVTRVRQRDLVLGEWRMRPGGGRGRGVTALFAGESGTGKTMSAEVVAGELGLELYTINLATVVDKYVGETEKNLERIFSEVDGVNGVLLFDEADALFGKRSEVRDAHDRYANIEVAYLLQRIESFDGLAILSTNLRANVDEAFTRRLDSVIDFPFPSETHRRILWDQCLGASIPLAGDVDLDFVARSFELSGGNIRSIALTAGYLAAERRDEIDMADLIRAVHREYRKLGRLSVRSEFGKYYEIVERESQE